MGNSKLPASLHHDKRWLGGCPVIPIQSKAKDFMAKVRPEFFYKLSLHDFFFQI